MRVLAPGRSRTKPAEPGKISVRACLFAGGANESRGKCASPLLPRRGTQTPTTLCALKETNGVASAHLRNAVTQKPTRPKTATPLSPLCRCPKRRIHWVRHGGSAGCCRAPIPAVRPQPQVPRRTAHKGAVDRPAKFDCGLSCGDSAVVYGKCPMWHPLRSTTAQATWAPGRPRVSLNPANSR